MKDWQKTILTLGGLGIAGYFVYKRFVVPELQFISELPGPVEDSQPEVSATPGNLDLPLKKGIRVKAGRKYTTRADYFVNVRRLGYFYAQVESATRLKSGVIVRKFTANVNGIFTKRLLNDAGTVYAEIAPG